ncbi:MAG TPA: helix-hairpin-helix domain-containing protein [Candidatus Saccharimonadales bacterium]|nr:helix-hairpin-helix domain-containing protein [Candidatus Saccharimonadales bacterium]
MKTHRRSALSGLEGIPGIGPSLAADLRSLGIQTPSDLRRRNPETLYRRLCAATGGPVDRCVLYAFRCAVYFATETAHDARLLKWWNWTDERMARRRPAAHAGA